MKILNEESTADQFFGLSDQEACQKFEGSFMGSLIGICIGKKFEGIWGPNLAEIIQEYTVIKHRAINYNESECCTSDQYNGDIRLKIWDVFKNMA